MRKKKYDVGDEIFYIGSDTPIGIVVGISETRWSDQDFSDITYVVSTPRGSLRRVPEKDVSDVKK